MSARWRRGHGELSPAPPPSLTPMLTPSLLLLACFASPATAHPELSRAAAHHQRDCNGNGIEDGVDIGNGTSLDLNRNGVPDECEAVAPV